MSASARVRDTDAFAAPAQLRSEAEVQAELGHTVLAAADALEARGDGDAARIEFRRAAEAFRACLRVRPDIPVVHRALAEALERGREDLGQALMHYLQAANDVRLAGPALRDARRLLGSAAVRDVPRAAAWMPDWAADRAEPATAELYRFRAAAKLAAGAVADAIEDWSVVLELDEHDLDTRVSLARAYRRDGQLDRAIEHFVIALDQARAANEQAQISLALGQTLLQHGDVADARAALAAAPPADQLTDALVALELANCSLAAKAPAEALESLKRCDTGDALPGSARVQFELIRAQASLALDMPDDAIAAAQRALELDPTSADAMLLQARGLLSPRHDSATDPAQLRQRSEQAEVLLQLYLRQRPGDLEAQHLRVRTLSASGATPERVAEALSAIVDAAPEEARTSLLVELAEADLAAGRIDAAKRTLHRADARPELRTARWWLASAAVAAATGEPDTAQAAYEQASAAGEHDHALVSGYAGAMAAAGRHADAAGAWRAVLEHEPEDFPAQLGLAQALREQGELLPALDAAHAAWLVTSETELEAEALQLKADLLEQLERSPEERADALLEAGRHWYWRTPPHGERARRALLGARELRAHHAPTSWYLADLDLIESTLPDPPYIDFDRIEAGLEHWHEARETPSGEYAWAFATLAWLEMQISHKDDAPSDHLWRAIILLERAVLAGDAMRADRWSLLASIYRMKNLPWTALRILDDDPAKLPARNLDELDARDRQTLLEILDERAAIFTNLGRVEDAIPVIERRRAIEPAMFSDAILTSLYRLSGRLPEAIALARQLVGKDAETAWYRTLLAGCLRRDNQLAAAAEQLQRLWGGRAAMLSPSDRGRVAWAGSMLVMQHEGDAAILDEVIERFAVLAATWEPGLPDAEEAGSFGIALLQRGDLEDGLRWLSVAIGAVTTDSELDDLTDDLVALMGYARASADAEAIAGIVSDVFGRIRERRTQLAGIIVTPRDELERVIAGAAAPDRLSAVAAHATLARFDAADDRQTEAVEHYAALLHDAPALVPESESALDTVRRRLVAEGDIAMAGEDPGAAARAYASAAAIVRRIWSADDPRLGAIAARRACAQLELGELEPARVSVAAGLAAIEPEVFGREAAAVVRDVEHYWALDDLWAALDEAGGIRAGLRTALDREFALGAPEPAAPVLTPIALEIGSGLVAEDTSTEHWPLFTTWIPAMRDAIERDVGIVVPGVRVREVIDIADGGYVIRFDEAVVERGEVPTDALEEVIRRLHAQLRRHMHEFLTLQDLVALLDRWRERAELATRIEALGLDDRLTGRLRRLLGGLLAEGVPLTAPAAILDAVAAAGLGDGAYAPALRAARLALREQLPGTGAGWLREPLPEPLEQRLRAGEAEAEAELERLLERPGPPPALVVADPALRPVVRRVVARRRPDVPVLAREEVVE